MNFLCDVHIAYKVKIFLIAQGHHAIHANDLPQKSETQDRDICSHADAGSFVVITKDADFVDLYFVKHSPKKIIKINLGNIATVELISLLSTLLPQMQKVMARENFLIEIDKGGTFTVDQID